MQVEQRSSLSRPRGRPDQSNPRHLNLILPSQAESLHSFTASNERTLSLFFQGTRCSSRCPSRSETSSRLMNTNRSVQTLLFSTKESFTTARKLWSLLSLEDINSPQRAREAVRKREPFISLKAYYETRRKSFPPSWPPQMVPLMAAAGVIRGGMEGENAPRWDSRYCSNRTNLLSMGDSSANCLYRETLNLVW